MHDADHPPAWAFDAWRLFRPDMSEHHFRQMWWKFVKENPTHASEARAEAHLARWLERERVKDAAPVVDRSPQVVEETAHAAPTFDEDELPTLDAPDDAPAPPESIQRPITARIESTRQRLALLALEDDSDEVARAPPHAASA